MTGTATTATTTKKERLPWRWRRHWSLAATNGDAPLFLLFRFRNSFRSKESGRNESQTKQRYPLVAQLRRRRSPLVGGGDQWRRSSFSSLFFFCACPLYPRLFFPFFFRLSFCFFFCFFLFLFPPFPASCFAEQVALATAPPDADDLSPRRRRQQVGLTKLFFSFKQKKTTLSTTKRSGKKKRERS